MGSKTGYGFKFTHFFLSVFFMGAALSFAQAQSSTNCKQTTEPEAVRQASDMAAKTLEFLNSQGGQVAVLARVGSDISDQGLRYTHAGFAYKAGKNWKVVHLLNRCGTDKSGIFEQGLTNFFLDDLFAYDALVVFPTQAIQQRLASIVRGSGARLMHNSHYSLIAKPSSTIYQNSNQWLLETLTMAQGGTRNRVQAQNFEAAHGYQPDTVSVGWIKRFGASLTHPNVHFDDHSPEEESAGRYEVVTVRSVVNYMRSNGLINKEYVLTPEGGASRPGRL